VTWVGVSNPPSLPGIVLLGGRLLPLMKLSNPDAMKVATWF